MYYTRTLMVLLNHLNGLSAGKDFIEFGHREELKSVTKWMVQAPSFSTSMETSVLLSMYTYLSHRPPDSEKCKEYSSSVGLGE
jgi:hypothetical protein